MNLNYLDFEQPIAELEEKITELRNITQDSAIDIVEEVNRLREKSSELTKKIFSSLDTAQIVQLARHPMRPHASDYIAHLFTDFDEHLGDRHFGAGRALIGGTARLNGEPVMVIGHEKGRQTAEKLKRNFGMPQPEGYRKALRLMDMAEKFNMPLITFIDTMGAYPGIGAEERNQSEAIAKNLLRLSDLKVPVICVVTGEGGSGGALAIGMGDRVYMLEYSIFSVISPEGCASILWKDASRAGEAAKAMGVTAKHVNKAGLIDGIIPEPLGGAHRDPATMAQSLKAIVTQELSVLKAMSVDDLLAARYQKFMAMGIEA